MHALITLGAMGSTNCDGGRISEVIYYTVIVDFYQGSWGTDWEHTRWHAMAGWKGKTPQGKAEAQAAWQNWIDQNMKIATQKCSAKELGFALHAVQDSFAKG